MVELTRDSPSWIGELELVDSTLREGLQSDCASVSVEDQVAIAEMLAELGMDVIELSNPICSEAAQEQARRLLKRDLGSTRFAVHLRCVAEDIRCAIDLGFTDLHLFVPGSPRLRQASLGMDLEKAIELAIRGLELARELLPEARLRITSEDSFRTPLPELERFIREVARSTTVDRFGLADTLGSAHPIEVYRRVSAVRAWVQQGIEFHGHNDSGCAVANALLAAEAGATHIDLSVLGLGERNGITATEGFIAAMLARDEEAVASRLRLPLLRPLADKVSQAFGVALPPAACLISERAFTHKAGVHTKAMLEDTRSYEFIDPARVGGQRRLLLGHGMTGSHLLHERAQTLGLELDPTEIRDIAAWVRLEASRCNLTATEVDEALRRGPRRAWGSPLKGD